ncbi:Uncharacterised protein [Collinsella intestinalis]|nr:Uncharacterised protein [Collinsella intestinalis]
MPMATSTILAVLESFSLRASFTWRFVGAASGSGARLILALFLFTAITRAFLHL